MSLQAIIGTNRMVPDLKCIEILSRHRGPKVSRIPRLAAGPIHQRDGLRIDIADWSDPMFGRMRISHRLLLLLVPVLLVTLVTTVWLGLSELRQSLLDDRKEAIKNIVQMAGHVLDIWYAKEKSGALSRDAAQLPFSSTNQFSIAAAP